MLTSMTGFGAAAGEVEGVQYAVEIRSVNNRYFKAVIKLPENWSHAEAEIEKLLRSELHRGTVTLTLRMKVTDEEATYNVNTAALSKYVDQLKPLEIDANPILRIDLSSLLQLPGVCQPPSMEELCQRTREGLMKLLKSAVDEVVEMRRREGKVVAADLLGNCEVVESNLATVTDRAPQVVKDYQQRLTDRVKDLTNAGKIEIDAENLMREIAIFAERCDVAEEVSRLAGHVEQFRQTVVGPQPAGRKLDFIAQEMLREANTIASKANDSQIARAVVEMKTAIDRIKEQVQNVE